MPPKLTRPVRHNPSGSPMLRILPGTARHIGTLLVARRRHDLPQCNTSVIRRYALVPEWAEPRGAQAAYGLLRQIRILETAARQDDLLPAHVHGHAHDCCCQRIMEASRDAPRR